MNPLAPRLRHRAARLLRAATLLLACVLAACATQPPKRIIVSKHAPGAEVRAWLQVQTKPAHFLSSNGHWYGTDFDEEIILGPENRLKVIVYGVGVFEHPGTFSIDAAGALHFNLPHYQGLRVYYFRQTPRGTFLFPEGANLTLEIEKKRWPASSPATWLFRHSTK